MLVTKKNIRKNILTQREKIDPGLVFINSSAIFFNLLKIKVLQSAKNILFYYPINNEVDTKLMIPYFWQQDKKIYLPKVENNELTANLFTPEDSLEKGSFNIYQSTNEKILNNNPDITIIPCSVCDHSKYRIGYGKGFYDRYLASRKTFKIGLCYDFQILSSIPYEEHDQQLDLAITENRVIH